MRPTNAEIVHSTRAGDAHPRRARALYAFFIRACASVPVSIALGASFVCPGLAQEFRGAGEAAVGLVAASSSTRIEAAQYLAREKAADQVPALAARRSAERDPRVKQALVVALANLGEPAFAALKAALLDPLPEARLEAVVGLGRLGTPQSTTELIAHFEREDNDGVRQQVLFWLGASRDSRALAVLQRGLQDGNPNLRAQAAHALGWLGTGTAKSAARKAAADPDERVRKAAEQASR